MNWLAIISAFLAGYFTCLRQALRVGPRKSIDDLLDETERHHKRIQQIQEKHHA